MSPIIHSSGCTAPNTTTPPPLWEPSRQMSQRATSGQKGALFYYFGSRQGCGFRSGRICSFCLKFLSWSGSGFSQDSGTKKKCRNVSKSDLSEENLKIMTKEHQKWKKQQFLIKTHHKIVGKIFKTEVTGSSLKKFMDPDPVNIRPDPQPCP